MPLAWIPVQGWAIRDPNDIWVYVLGYIMAERYVVETRHDRELQR